jgi:hypothetical protein
MDTSFQNYSKKIMPYLDGSLSSEEQSEFEAFVLTHPEFESQIKSKEEEVFLLKSLIPASALSYEANESLEDEMKESIFNLLKDEPRGFWGKVKDRWEEWTSR